METDVFFLPAYGKLYEPIDGGVCEVFTHRCEYGAVTNMFIKRPAPWLVDGKQYYDIRTPYGYGGPVMHAALDKPLLECAYQKAFTAHCLEQDIVCEFVRFHPLCENAPDFHHAYDVRYDRDTVAIDVADPDYAYTQFMPECRNKIRKAQKRGVTVRVEEAGLSEGMERFMELYSLTMDKNHASEYYYFPRSYYESICETLSGSVLYAEACLGETAIAASIFLYGGENMYYHLSATHPEYYSCAAINLVLSEVCRAARARGMRWLFLGGGYADGTDSLFQFKRSFGRTEQNLKRFYTGSAVYNEAIYQRLTGMASEKKTLHASYFPLYRG